MSKRKASLTPTRQAIAAAGGIAVVAHEFGVTHSAVAHWKDVPAKHVFRLAKLAGVPAEQLRPDLSNFEEHAA